MKSRVLTPEIFKNPLLAEFSDATRLFFLGLALEADDHGIVIDDPTVLNLELFPGDKRGIEQSLDLLVVTEVIDRAVTSKGVRVIVIRSKYMQPFLNSRKPAKSKFGELETLMLLPAPSDVHRQAIRQRIADERHAQGEAASLKSASIQCEECGRQGQLFFVVPRLGFSAEEFSQTVVTKVVEIVPVFDSPGDPAEARLLCRDCRTDMSYVSPLDNVTDANVIDIQSGQIRQVFDAWKIGADKSSNTVLTDKRRKKIRWALDHYPIEDVLDAVVGWKNSSFHKGDNDGGTVYNELELLLRNGDNIERFRDLHRSGPTKTGAARNVGVFEHASSSRESL